MIPARNYYKNYLDHFTKREAIEKEEEEKAKELVPKYGINNQYTSKKFDYSVGVQAPQLKLIDDMPKV